MITECANQIAWNHYFYRLKTSLDQIITSKNPYLDQIITSQNPKLGPDNNFTAYIVNLFLFLFFCLSLSISLFSLYLRQYLSPSLCELVVLGNTRDQIASAQPQETLQDLKIVWVAGPPHIADVRREQNMRTRKKEPRSRDERKKDAERETKRNRARAKEREPREKET